MGIPIYQIDSFAEAAFAGNPAAVCLMDSPATDSWLQRMASEMNLSETAFVWRTESRFQLRWFTPEVEVDLCGHATLATAHALWEAGWLRPEEIASFESRSGALTASQSDGKIWLDFPSEPPIEESAKSEILKALGVHEVRWFGRNRFDYFIEVNDEAAVRACQPDFVRLGETTERGAIVMAASDQDGVDFVSRFFGPACGINEDPVTGSAHVGLAPYFAERLGKNQLTGYQASSRGGRVETEVVGDRVRLGGSAVTVFCGELQIPVDQEPH